MDTITKYGTVAERVARGVRVIIAAGHTLAEIDLDTMNVRSIDSCPAGQTMGYMAYANTFGGDPWTDQDARNDGLRRAGFLWEPDESITDLQREWLRVIAEAQGVEAPEQPWPYDRGGYDDSVCTCPACRVDSEDD